MKPAHTCTRACNITRRRGRGRVDSHGLSCVNACVGGAGEGGEGACASLVLSDVHITEMHKIIIIHMTEMHNDHRFVLSDEIPERSRVCVYVWCGVCV